MKYNPNLRHAVFKCKTPNASKVKALYKTIDATPSFVPGCVQSLDNVVSVHIEISRNT